MILKSDSVEQTMEYARALAELVEPDDAIVLTGDLGAGKTHFSKGFAQALGVEDEITSPTFPLVIEYEEGCLPLMHFDLYRLEDSSQLDDIDFYELVECGGVSLIEWGDRFVEELPDSYITVAIAVDEGGDRTLEFTACGARANDLLSAFGRQCDLRSFHVLPN